MASAVLAEIIGTRMAEEGTGGYYTNSTNYSMLVYYSDGTVQLIEGDAAHIRPYLHLVRPKLSMPDLAGLQNAITAAIAFENNRLQNELENKYERLCKELDKLHTDMVSTQSVIKDMASLLLPVPDIIGKSRDEAVHILNSNHFIYVEDDNISKQVSGSVIQASRDHDKFNVMHVKVKYELPNIIGTDIEEAQRILKALGFLISVKAGTCIDDSLANKVVKVNYTEGSKVELEIALSEYDGFLENLDNADSIVDVQTIWNQNKLAKTYPKTDAMITEHAENEKQFGRSLNIGLIKLNIKHSFDEERINNRPSSGDTDQ